MTRTLTSALALTLGIGTETAVQAAGYTSTSIPAEHRDRDIDLHIWYPTDANGEMIPIGQNAVFKGHQVHPNATPRKGNYPLVILSHGSGGNALNIGWIASFLADQGMIVAATNHPGTTSGNSTQAETVKVWQRTADITTIIDHFENAGAAELSPDMSKIGAVGFSLGGYTVLASAGARVNKQAFIDYCDTYPDLWDCAWYARGGVDLRDTDQTLFEQSNLDPRITAVVSIDPALAQAYDAQSLTGITIPVAIINLGDTATVPIALDGATIAPLLKNGELTHVEGAHHFSFLGECTPIGQKILDGTDEGPLCIEVSDRNRADIHKEVGTQTARFLRSGF